MKKSLFLGMVLTVCGGLAFGQATENVGDTPVLNTNEGPFTAVDEVPPGNLYSNGPYFNDEFNGNDISRLLSGLGMTTFGFNVSAAFDYRIADDWENTENVEVENMIFYGYQTGSGNGSTMMGVTLRIWDGSPDDAASSVIWGDEFENIMDDSDWTGAYRVSENDIGGTDRPIMYIEAGTPGLTLAPGTYWVDFQLDGSASSGPWAPPIALVDETATGNALQLIEEGTVWAPVVDDGSASPQGFPFEVNGDVILAVNDLSSTQVSIYPSVTSMYVNVNARTDIQSVTVYNMNGQQVMTQDAKGMNAALNVSSLPSGVYILKAVVDGKVKTFKFIRK